MSDYVIPQGAETSPDITIKVNGADLSVRAGEPFRPSTQQLEVLSQSRFGDDIVPVAEDLPTLAVIDLVRDIYTVDGVVVGITDIFDATHPDTQFNADWYRDSGGIKAALVDAAYVGPWVEFKEPLLSMMLSGCTIVVEMITGTDTIDGSFSTRAHDGPYNVDNAPLVSDRSVTRLWELLGTNVTSDGLPANQVNRIAFTMGLTRSAVSVNGAAVVAIELPGIDETVTNLAFTWGGLATARLRMITVYTAVADVGLPALSAP